MSRFLVAALVAALLPVAAANAATPLTNDPSVAYRQVSGGIQVLDYYVKATKDARIVVVCSSGCPRTQTSGRGARRVRIKGVSGRRLRNGTKITVTVSLAGHATAVVVDKVRDSRRREGTKTCVKPNTTVRLACNAAIEVAAAPGVTPAPVVPAPVVPVPTIVPLPTVTPTPPLFPPPAAATTGDTAFAEIRGYVADSRFTDCVAGWPSCAVEQRYSHFADSSQQYCRLTPTSGSDIRSFGVISRINGAEHNLDGSWGFEYVLSSYGSTVFYSWSVSPTGVTNGRYWGPGREPASGAPDTVIGPLQWVRGARDCGSD